MARSSDKWSTVTLLPAVLLSIFSITVCPDDVLGQDTTKTYIGIRMPAQQDPLVPIIEEDQFLGFHMNGTRSPLLKQTLASVKREANIDSTGRNINFAEKMLDFDFRMPAYLTLDNYSRRRLNGNLKTHWRRNTISKLGEQSRYQTRGGGGLRIDIPVEIKSKAFQKIFGSGTVGLDVTGDITIRGGFRHEKRSEVKTALTRGSDYNFKMEQTQRFRVQGHIGDKVTIGVDQDSERAFDFENNIQLKYQGYEDEIVQSIEAGNIALSLPGTRFVTFGGQSSGLFGIKAAMTLGNLKLTAIASQEKGENKKLSFKGGASEDVKQINDYRYLRGTYYFIDEHNRNLFSIRGEDGEFKYDPSRKIAQIEVYKSEPNYQQRYTESIRGWAWAPRPEDEDKLILTEGDTTRAGAETYLGYFLRLEKTDYYFDPDLGYLRMNMPLSDGEVLAIAYRDSSGRVRGDIDFDPEDTKPLQLRMIKPAKPRPSDKTWKLEWKNVYNLGGRNIPEDGFELRLFYKPPSGDPEETMEVNGSRITFLQVFGLDKVDRNGGTTPDNIIDKNPNVLRLAEGELWFPDLRPFDPVTDEYKALLPEDKRAPALYDTTVQSVINAQSKFYIEVKSKTRSTEHRLGMNIIENSEEVILNGRRLNRGTDYTIDYFTGTLRILNDEASLPSANLDITYESNQLFQIDKKTVMGARAEYLLWDESFIGATFLYLNERTLDQKIRIGKGPMRNMVWDVNTLLTAKPFFLTRLADYLPFVDTREPSSIRFEGELAQVLPNPNTRNNEPTGDNDGVAYIDDFEAAKRITPISIARRSWIDCSAPLSKIDINKTYPSLENRGHLIWYEPYNQYPIRQIWPNRDINANVAQTTNILQMRFTPADTIAGIKESWGGIQKALSAGYYDQTEAKFLEIWVNGDEGVLHIDMGQVSEDIIPNRKLNTEDEMHNNIRNNLLDEGEDKGIDEMSDSDPRAVAAGGDFWDINGNGVRDYGEPYSQDAWSYSAGSADYSRINGTEGNANDYGGRRPDSEDMNGNGDVDLRNDYFEYTICLRRDHPDTQYIAGASIDKESGEDYGWRQYRIPLDVLEPTLKKFGNPDFSLIEYIRIWIDGFENSGPREIWIAEINLVGSEWKELGVAGPDEPEKYDTEDDKTVSVTVVNTHDNPDYPPPPSVQGEVDRITRVIQREQALVMKIADLQPGYNGIIKKTFYEPQDYIRYNTLKMFVYGKDPRNSHMKEDSSKVEFFLRFGSDLNNYYEVRLLVHQGWGKNNIEVDLGELSAIKLDSTYFDSTGVQRGFYKDKGNGMTYFIKGQPALRNVRMLVGGVRNLDTKMNFNGEIWLNELRLSNIKKDKGMAMRARMDLDWAGLVRFNGEFQREDADFHNVATRFGDGDTRTSMTLNTNVNLERFLPSKLGIVLPFSYNYSRSEASPKYKPGTDVETKNIQNDSLVNSIRNIREKTGFSISFSVRSRSQNFFVKHLLSNLRASFSESNSTGSDSRTKLSLNKSQSGNMDWSLRFSQNNYIRPFKWLGTSQLVSKLADMKLYYTPTSINIKHAGTRTVSEQTTRTEVFSSNNSFNVNRSYSGQMKIFETFSFDVSRSYTHDLQDISKDTLMVQLREGRIGLLTNLTQNFQVKYNPRFFSWLSSNFSYSAGFKYGFNRQQRLQAKNASLSKNLSLSGNFDLARLVQSIYRPDPVRGGTRRPPARRPSPGSTPGSTQTPDKEEEKGSGFSVLGLFVKLFDIFEPVNANFSKRNNISVYGIKEIPGPAFQFGFKDSVNIPLETGAEGGTDGANVNRGSKGYDENISLSSGLKILRGIQVSLKYDNSKRLNTSTTTTGSRSHSRFVYGEDIDMPFPDWTVRIGNLEKLPLLNKYVQRVSLEHGRSGQYDQTFNVENGQETITKDDRSSSFRPLLGLNISLKNGMTVNVRFNTSEKTSISKSFGIGGTKALTSDLSITANYSKRSDFRLPIPVWPFKNMRLKNNIDLSITFSMGDNITKKSRGGGGYEVTGETSKWFFKPNLNYSFSDRVRGGAHFEIGKTHNKLIGDSSYKELGIDVNISIRGS